MAEDPIRKELDALKADIAQLRDDIAGLSTAVKQAGTDKAQEACAQAEAAAHDTWQEIEDKLNDVIEEGKKTINSAEQQIGQHPRGSLLTAFGLGFIIAKLFGGGERR